MVHRLFRIKESLAKLHKDLGHILENFLKNSQVVFEAHVAPQFYFYFLQINSRVSIANFIIFSTWVDMNLYQSSTIGSSIKLTNQNLEATIGTINCSKFSYKISFLVFPSLSFWFPLLTNQLQRN